jgi:arylformamidase
MEADFKQRPLLDTGSLDMSSDTAARRTRDRIAKVGPASSNLDPQYDLRAAFPDYVDFFEQWRQRSEQARQELRPLLDLRYGPGPRDQVDVFPAQGGNGRLLVFVHGGYWRSMDKYDFSFIAAPYLERGVSVALINYALFPGTTMSAIVAQVCKACAWLAGNARSLGVACEQMHLAGWSAGAHLAAVAACCADRAVRAGDKVPGISTVLAISGVYDLRPLLHTSANVDLQLDEDEARRNSPLHMRPYSARRVAVVWGGCETDAFRQQSQAFVAHWRSKSIDITGYEIAGVHHYAVMNEMADEASAVFAISQQLLCVGLQEG